MSSPTFEIKCSLCGEILHKDNIMFPPIPADSFDASRNKYFDICKNCWEKIEPEAELLEEPSDCLVRPDTHALCALYSTTQFLMEQDTSTTHKHESSCLDGQKDYSPDYQGLYPILEQFGYYDAQIKRIHFRDECACLSDVTVDPCSLNIEITTTLPFTYEMQCKVNDAIHAWAYENLKWRGCSGCDNQLTVDSRLFPEENYQADWAIPQPVKKVLINSMLYTGGDAIDKLGDLVSGDMLYTPIIVHVATAMKERKSFLVSVRKIDTYKDYISLYTHVGILPLYIETPTPITQDVVEAIEIPNKINVCPLSSSKQQLIGALMSTRDKT